jgi:ferritin-like metal-binding protein YciE
MFKGEVMRDTIDMAREAGWTSYDSLDERFKAFEALVRADERNRTWTQEHWTDYERSIAAAEREACAKVCDAMNKYMDDGEECAAAIRARGNT